MRTIGHCCCSAREFKSDPIKSCIKINKTIVDSKYLDDNQKIQRLNEFIKSSKNKENKPQEDRTDAIKKLREMTGNPNLPIVKATKEAGLDSQVQDVLRKAFKPVPSEDNQTPFVNPDKSLMA